MGEKLVVGVPIDRGLRTDREPCVIDDDSFPVLVNAYQWRGRVKRKRGTALLGRLARQINSANLDPTTITLDGSGVGNLITGFSLQTDASLVPGTLSLVGAFSTYTDPDSDGVLVDIGLAVAGSVNYASGEITILAEAGQNITAVFDYYPTLPVMGLEDLNLPTNDNPGTIAFDTKYSYNISTTKPYTITDVSFYKNPPEDSTNLPFYTPKSALTPLTWNGFDYQQFWTTNYENAFWATNGIAVPFSLSNIGMQFRRIEALSIYAGPPAPPGPPVTLLIQITGHGLVVGDFVYLNEVVGLVGANWQTGYVTFKFDNDNIAVTFPNASITGAYVTGGILQYLTNTAIEGVDCIRWYDGNPIGETPAGSGFGWVNFMPPLSENAYSIANLPPDVYYLVGGRVIIPFKDRLLVFGPVVQTSAVGESPKYLQDTVIYSQNGTPYYTSSYENNPSGTDNPTSPQITFHPILVPDNQTATAPAWFEDQTGFGGFISAGVQQPIVAVSTNEDALIIGFSTNLQTRFIYSGNDIIPFNFFYINSELGTSSTFSAVNMDQGILSRGPRGLIMTSQTTCNRIDLSIPDQVFQMRNLDNGAERFCAQRDFISEWVYFTYPSNRTTYVFPSQSLQFNYRDNSWAIFNESYTTYGSFQKLTGNTWASIGAEFGTWGKWNEPWGAGSNTLLQPEVIGGNAQGFVILRNQGTNEATSLAIQNISGSTITSPNHMLDEGDYIIIRGAIGTVDQYVNGRVFRVQVTDENIFVLSPNITSGTYLGGGLIERLYVPFFQTKQFPTAWGYGRKTRIGPQQYLLTKTANSQITVNIYLSQNADSPYTSDVIYPDPNADSNSLVYSNIVYTCPESTNIGLTPANTNLQMPGAIKQSQIWHRKNTSLIGDTVQLGFTLSDAQMRTLTDSVPIGTITAATQANPCVLDCTTIYDPQTLVRIDGVVGMTELNTNVYLVLASDGTNTTIAVDSSAFTAYVSGGTVTPVSPVFQTDEIELHAFVLDVSPSSLLC